jgi:crossover junction endodeoxyribonuclease RuvC
MIILGIDPGYDRLGIAVIDKPAKGKEALIYSACFQTSSKEDIYARFGKIGAEMARILDEFKPEAMALETLFITKNQKTAMRVAEARGIIIHEAVRRGIAVHEYGPGQIKMAVTSDGSADKLRVTKMIGILVDLPPKKPGQAAMIDDEYDAIAVALTHAAHAR